MTDRPRPVNCRCMVTPILAPAAVVPPLGMFPKLGTIEPLPKLTVTPSRLYAEPITFDDNALLDAGRVSDLVREVEAKLRAEDERMRRLLPPPLPGHEWHVEIAHDVEHVAAFTMHDVIRLRYRLVEVGTR